MPGRPAGPAGPSDPGGPMGPGSPSGPMGPCCGKTVDPNGFVVSILWAFLGGGSISIILLF